MASFIPALSIFILVLFNGCFTLPIVVDEQLSSSTFPSLNDDLTTEHALNLRLVPDNETSVLPDIDKKGLIDEHMGFEMSTSFYNSPVEKVGRALRTFDELTVTESITFTTESSLPDKRDHDDLSFTTIEPTTYTTESSFADKGDHDDFSFTTIEPTTYTSESSFTDKQDHDNVLFTTVEPTTYTSESSFGDKGDHDDLSFTTIEPTTPLPELERRSFTSEFENETETESETDKREMQVEFTTSDMLSFTSTASNVAPALYTSQSSNSTSTEKYTGLLKYQNENQEEEEPEQSTKLTKTVKKVLPTKSSKVQSEDQSDDQSAEDPKEPTAPTAVFDQEALKKISYIPNDFMVLDENNTLVVTDIPEKHSASTMKNKNEQQPLTQGEESLQPEEKESHH